MFLTLEELTNRAKKNERMPNALAFHEKMYFLCCRSIYQQYSQKTITLEQAKQEKQKVLDDYNCCKRQYEFCINVFKIQDQLESIIESGIDEQKQEELMTQIHKTIKGEI